MSDLINPVTKIAELSDSFPILLCPLRLETRFKTVNSLRQLWLRVFPDDCNVVHKEEQLSETELRNVKTFWTEIWKAEGDETAEKGAWKSLVNAHGTGRAGWMVAHYKPLNPQPAPLEFPDDASINTSPTSWTKAPKAVALPDRFAAIAYTGPIKQVFLFDQNVADDLPVGPDPSLPEEKQMRKDENGDLFVNEELKWMVDFDKAIAAGMGIKIPVNTLGAAVGFDKIIVVGIRFSTDEKASGTLLEHLISDHFESKGGFELLRQGTPTNNTEDEPSGHSSVENADDSYQRIFKKSQAFAASDDPTVKSDGQKVAEYLGIDPEILKKVPNANGRDQLEANAMNKALFPATLGYFMEEMMTPLFTDDLIDRTKDFFAEYVSGRGPVPAIRMGRQPYGILPVTAYSRLKFPAPDPGPVLVPRKNLQTIFLNKLQRLLMQMDESWAAQVSGISRISRNNVNPQQTLLDVLGLHPNSVEFHQRYSQSIKQLYNQLILQKDKVFADTVDLALGEIGKDISAGVDKDNLFNISTLPISKKYFLGGANLLGGPLVDDLPYSETTPVRPYTADGKKNYLEWLASSEAETVRLQDFGGSAAPNAILYLLLRHSLMLAQADTASRLIISKDPTRKKSEFLDPDFIGVQQEGGGQSKFQYLYSADRKITGNDTQKLVEFIYKPDILDKADEAKRLKETIDAIKMLINTPTARLERLLVEHLDCCNYRIDAWRTGLANYKLTEQRRIGQADEKPSKGIYLGAFGWLLDVRPQAKSLTDVPLSPELNKILNPDPGKPMQTDPENFGYIHAPSLNQAAAAAVLRSAYESNRNTGDGNPFAVNLTSDRVRIANNFLEGVRNGQSLSALLGYRFERGLHDRGGQIELDSYIYPLRKAFPLVADNLKDTLTETTDSIATIQANHVVDGLKMIAQIQKSGIQTFPFGLPPIAGLADNSPQASAINAEVLRMLDINDAIADLVVAEQAYQMVQGNFEKAAGVADAFSKSSYPPEIDIIQTPRSGTTLTQKVAIQFDTTASPDISPSSVAMTPKAKAEPGVNQWLAGIFPSPEKVLCQVDYTIPGQALQTIYASQKDLGLQPIDLLYVFNLDSEQFMTELDDRISHFIRYQVANDPKTKISIRYTSTIDKVDRSKVSFFELAALVKSLRKTLLGNKPLDQGAFTLPGSGRQVAPEMDDVQFKNRVTALRAELEPLQTDISILLEAHSALDVDELIQKTSTLFLKLAFFENSQTGAGFMFQPVSNDDAEAQQRTRKILKEEIKTAIGNIQKSLAEKLASSLDLIQQADAATNNHDKMNLLQSAVTQLLGEEALMLQHFKLSGELGSEIQNSFTSSNQLLDFTRNNERRFFPVDDWLAGVSRVREKVKHWENISALSAAFQPGSVTELTPLQFPFRAGDRWAAMKFRDEKDEADKFSINQDTLLYTTHFASPFDKTKTQCGIVVDEWTEVIPSPEQNTGIAFHYDQPNSEPPQTMLLVTPPEFTNNWKWEDLVSALEETLEMAKKRAVEPAMLEKTSYAQFLPTTMMAVTLHWITVATNLAINNNVYERMETN